MNTTDTITRETAAELIKRIENAWMADSSEYISDVDCTAYNAEDEIVDLAYASHVVITIDATRPSANKSAEDAQQDAAQKYCRIAADLLGVRTWNITWDCEGNGADGDLYSMKFILA